MSTYNPLAPLGSIYGNTQTTTPMFGTQKKTTPYNPLGSVGITLPGYSPAPDPYETPAGSIVHKTPTVSAPVVAAPTTKKAPVNTYSGVSTPPVTPVTPPTVGNAYKTATTSSYDDAYSRALAEQAARDQKDSNQHIPTPEEAYQNQVNLFQKEIDATNQVYAGILADTQLEGKDRLGSSGAIQARSGLLGSDFGAAQTDKINKANTDDVSLVRAQQAAAINAILGKARAGAVTEIQAKRDAAKAGSKDYLEHLAGMSDRKKAAIQALGTEFLQQGIDPSTIDPKELLAIAKARGIASSDIQLEYNAQKKTADETEAKAKAQALKDSRFSLGEGQRQFHTDPDTGEIVQDAYNPKTYDPNANGGSSGGLFGSDGIYAGDNPSFTGRSKAEYNSIIGSRSGIASTLHNYTDANGVHLDTKWALGQITPEDLSSLNDADAKSIVTHKAQIDEPGKNINLTAAEVQKQIDANNPFSALGQFVGQTTKNRNFDSGQVKDVLDSALAGSGGKETIVLTN